MVIRDGVVDGGPTHIESLELQLEAIRERELALDVRDAAERLFEQYGTSAFEELPEDVGRYHTVRELELPDHVSDSACISLEEYSDGGLHVSVGFESDDYVDEKGNTRVGRMIASATISGEHKLTSASIRTVGENGGINQENKFNARRDSPVSYLEHVLEILEAETIAYDTSIGVGIGQDPDELYYHPEEGSIRPDVDLGIILPEIALEAVWGE